MTRSRTVLITALLTIGCAGPFLWYEIDRNDPLIYEAAWFETVPTTPGAPGVVITEAAPQQKVVLVLKIKWPRTNCSTELQRNFIGSDGAIYKVPLAEGEPARLGPPPASRLAPDSTIVSRRTIVLPDLPTGIATHSANVWERCTSPAEKWGDYLSEAWPIFIGPKGADAKILITRERDG